MRYRSTPVRHDSFRPLPDHLAHLLGMNQIAVEAVPALLTQHELAEFLHLSERTLEDWRVTHSGPPYLKLGRHIRYDLADVRRWLGEQRHG
jgi:hypothetical protein